MNYEELYATFKWEPSAYFNFATDIIDKWAESDPNQLAMIWVDGQGESPPGECVLQLFVCFGDVSTSGDEVPIKTSVCEEFDFFIRPAG